MQSFTFPYFLVLISLSLSLLTPNPLIAGTHPRPINSPAFSDSDDSPFPIQ